MGSSDNYMGYDSERRNHGISPVEKEPREHHFMFLLLLMPGETKVIRLMMAWYVPDTNLKYGQDSEEKRRRNALIRMFM